MTKLLVNALLTLPLIGAYSMFALGIVVIYRASKVLNLAHGAMAALPAYVAYGLVSRGVPVYAALPLAIASGALLGVVVATFVIRPLRRESQTTQTVGTVAVLGVLLALIARVWGSAPLIAPNPFPDGRIPIGHTGLAYGDVGLAIVALVVSGGFAMLFAFTDMGLMMRGAADNPRAALLMGIDPRKSVLLAWAFGGGLAAIAGTLLAGVTNLHPYTLSHQVLPAFVAALLGGIGSFGGAIVGSVIVGLAQGVVSTIGPLADQAGSPQLVLAVLALAVMAFRGKRIAGVSDLEPPTASTRVGSARNGKRWLIAMLIALPFLVVWPYVVPSSVLADSNLAAIYVVIAVSLVVLTGWVGQISLSQGAFVGVAAFATGLLVRKLGIAFPFNLPIAAIVAAGTAILLGTVALRVRGLYLAVATLIFGWMADAYLFKSSWLVGAGGSSTITGRVIGRPGAYLSFDLTDRRSFWFIAVAAAMLALAAAANLRDSKIGRAFFAVRGSEMAAASLGIDVTRIKLLAFGASGVMAGIAGNLIMIDQRTAAPDQFSFTASVFFLSIAVVGGLTSLGGAVVAGIAFAALSGLSYRVPALGAYLDVISSGLLLVAVLTSPLISSGRLRISVPGWLRRTSGRPDRPALQPSEPKASSERIHSIEVIEPAGSMKNAGPILSMDKVTVQFGGLVASKDVNLEVRRGEVVGLIGPNGAGKTTAFNAISGFVRPTSGSVRLFGTDVTDLDVHQRSALGLARTFQVLQLFKGTTVFDNLLTATHLQFKTNVVSHLLITTKAVKAEQKAHRVVHEVLDLVDLSAYADTNVEDLPFGVLRMVDVARALVTGAEMLLLDEPASGLDGRETDQLARLLGNVMEKLDRTILLVEHDVRFVTSITDRIYVLDRGQIIASGTPDEIRNNDAVIAAYLGAPAEGELASVP
ncbi:MAG: ATP-binding cassette domain-containing protein [Actinomycetota bacterium]|nr:ATP-binding cassette domain-containing protein [Actinomycetota bacterium]